MQVHPLRPCTPDPIPYIMVLGPCIGSLGLRTRARVYREGFLSIDVSGQLSINGLIGHIAIPP